MAHPRSHPVKLFDRQNIRRPSTAQYVDFIDRFLGDELVERLFLVQRRFESGLFCGPVTQAVKAIWDTATVSWLYITPTPFDCSDAVADLCVPFRRSMPLVVSLNALHLADDPVAALAELRGALVPDGLFLGAAAASGTLHELSDSLLRAEAELSGGAAMRVAPFADIRQWGDALARAGFALPVADEVSVTVRYNGLAALLADLRGMRARGVLAQRAPAPRRLFERAGEIYRERYSDPDGRIRATFRFACLSGWAPDPSQQKPARRGSATMRLADALKDAGRGE